MPATHLRVRLLSVTPNAEALVYANAKQCTSADDAASIYEQATTAEDWGGTPDEDQRTLIRRVMASGHLGIVEPVVFSFGVAGVSRALSHQLVRQRIASFCQQSQRTVKADGFDYVVPPSINTYHEDVNIETRSIDVWPSDALQAFNDAMNLARETYRNLIRLGIPAEDARFVLPNACETKICVTMNARSLLHFFEQRCCTRCFDEKTEVLTNEGWKFFFQLSGGELFYSINLDTHESELVSAKRFFNYHHNGNMVRLLSQSIDQLVTGNHKFVVSHDVGKKNKAYSLVEAESVKNMKTVLMKKNCLPISGNVPSTITLPGCVTSYKEYPSRDVDAGDFLQFLGFYLSDGCAYKSAHHLNITLCKGDLDKIGEYAELLQSITPNKVSLNMSEEAYKATVHDRVLFNFLSQFGKAKDKYIPEFVFDLDHSLISRLLQGLMDGDFSRQAKQYWTVSKRLADGIQRLLLHVGVSGTITTLQPRLNTHSGISSSGREFNITSQPSVTYIVSFNCSKNEPIIKRGDRDPFSTEEYDGNVYCVELEKNNTLYVRRNGKPSWSGNSQWEIRALANEMLRLCKEAVPVLFEKAGAACVRKGFCEEEKSCGRAPKLKDVMEKDKEDAPCA